MMAASFALQMAVDIVAGAGEPFEQHVNPGSSAGRLPKLQSAHEGQLSHLVATHTTILSCADAARCGCQPRLECVSIGSQQAIKLVTLCCRRMVLQDLAATRESPGDELRAEPSTEMAGRAGESCPASHNIAGQSFSAALELEVCLVMLVVSAVRDAAAPQCSTHGCLAFCHDNLRDVSAQGRRCSA